jgi:hypothetical protein
MGAVANLAPSQFRAIVAEVPFVDCLTTILDDTLPLTVTEWEEWGNPVEDEAVYDYMEGYTPYDNVTEQAYPAILATGGLNDPRVQYWEPAKWVAKLRAQDRQEPPGPQDGDGRHPPASGRYDAWRDEAFVLASSWINSPSPETSSPDAPLMATSGDCRSNSGFANWRGLPDVRPLTHTQQAPDFVPADGSFGRSRLFEHGWVCSGGPGNGLG